MLMHAVQEKQRNNKDARDDRSYLVCNTGRGVAHKHRLPIAFYTHLYFPFL